MSAEDEILKARRLINDICKVHSLCVDHAVRTLMQKGVRLSEIRHVFDDAGEETITYGIGEARGYFIEKEFLDNGRFECRAIPGHISITINGASWTKEERPVLHVNWHGHLNGA